MADVHNEAVGNALEGWVNSLPFEGDWNPGILGDWVAVVCMVDVDSKGHPVCKYYLAMKEGNMLPHVIKGLLSQGLDEIDRSEVDAE